MKRFKAIAQKTSNSYISILKIKEKISKEDSDGYVLIEGQEETFELEVHGKNSFKRAKLLASQINESNLTKNNIDI